MGLDPARCDPKTFRSTFTSRTQDGTWPVPSHWYPTAWVNRRASLTLSYFSVFSITKFSDLFLSVIVRRIAADPISPGVFAAAVCPCNRIVRSEPWQFTPGESPQRNRCELLATPGPSRLPQLFRQPATPPCRSAPDHPLGVRPDCGGASAPAPPP